MLLHLGCHLKEIMPDFYSIKSTSNGVVPRIDFLSSKSFAQASLAIVRKVGPDP